MSLTEQFRIEIAIVSVDKFSTPYFPEYGDGREPVLNQDYAAFSSELGCSIGDGIGGYDDGDQSSEFVVDRTLHWIKELGICELGGDDAADAILYEILPRVDAEMERDIVLPVGG